MVEWMPGKFSKALLKRDSSSFETYRLELQDDAQVNGMDVLGFMSLISSLFPRFIFDFMHQTPNDYIGGSHIFHPISGSLSAIRQTYDHSVRMDIMFMFMAELVGDIFMYNLH